MGLFNVLGVLLLLMDGHVTFLNESFSTMLANVRLLSRVYFPVPCQLLSLPEFFQTFFAFIRLLSCVNSFMVCQFPRNEEAFVAASVSAAVLPVIQMDPCKMIFHERLGQEPFLTPVTLHFLGAMRFIFVDFQITFPLQEFLEDK